MKISRIAIFLLFIVNLVFLILMVSSAFRNGFDKEAISALFNLIMNQVVFGIFFWLDKEQTKTRDMLAAARHSLSCEDTCNIWYGGKCDCKNSKG